MDFWSYARNQWAKQRKRARRLYFGFLAQEPALVVALWLLRGRRGPTPSPIKRQLLRRFGISGATWVETGTYRGDTTQYLAGLGSRVYSLEPDPDLYESARFRFSGQEKVTLINGSSEDVFPKLLPSLCGPLSFWLDGHYSGHGTFQGKTISPIAEELGAISSFRRPGIPLVVIVDDVRLFRDSSSGYPSLDFLIDWARKEDLHWGVVHDLFVASTSRLRRA